MGGFNMTLTLGIVLEEARERGLRVDVETATGRVYEGVRVAALEQFCVVLLDDLAAHVVAREHLAAVSLDRSAFLEIEPRTVDLRASSVGEAAFAV
ncbi:MAG: hypothetical protein ACRDWY_06685 [Actinomycetes bacterium]